MVLHRFMCNQFGYQSLRECLNQINPLEHQSGNNQESIYARHLMEALPATASVTRDDIDRYDQNIQCVGNKLRIGSDGGKSWKAFQYLALLFTERYLDLLGDRDALVEMLNRWIETDSLAGDMAEYEVDQLDTLAFQSATGSGKTLLLHANILQYLNHLECTGHRHTLNKIILVTPDEGLSNQHLQELRASGMAARLFSDVSSSGMLPIDEDVVDIIDLHKLSETQGVKRVSLESFGENNLVMVDEGHLGMGGKKWRSHRRQLGANGFTFEYSATFNQAVAGSTPEIREMRDEYGKSILFDYSYKYFHEDGYGKDYQISNLRQTDDAELNDRYLLACLLMFYQQSRIYADKIGSWLDFELARPLCVFLGKTVKAGGQLETQSDVVQIVKFLAGVLKGAEVNLKTILAGQAGLLDSNHQELFANSFGYLKDRWQSHDDLRYDLLQTVFQGTGELRLLHLAGTDEIQLCAGDSEPFGVINVGDASGLYQKLSEQAEGAGYSCEKDNFSAALFDTVDTDSSPVNIVIGARKFIAGWNSWRVSTMGLMHVGTGEGPQIIQMFGRGVRLRGQGLSLKRHTELPDIEVEESHLLRLLETLNIFGLRANYMSRFKEYLQQDGVNADRIELNFPTVQQFDRINLKQIRKNPEAGEYEFSECRPELPINTYPQKPVSLNRYRSLEILQSQEAAAGAVGNRDEGFLSPDLHLRLINLQRVYHRVMERKRTSGWHNLIIRPEIIQTLLENSDWYQLHIQPEKLRFHSCAQIQEWEDIAVELICRHAGQYWRHERSRWEHEHLEVIALGKADENLIGSYKILIDASEDELIAEIQELIEAVSNEHFPEDFEKRLDSSGNGKLSVLFPSFHAYIPILYADQNAGEKVKSIPGLINEGEAELVRYLRKLLESEESPRQEFFAGKKIYLMRNQAGGRGISFFPDSSFYPDFILWMVTGDRQDILFIDPKGLIFYDDKTDAKVGVHSGIKRTEAKIQEMHPDVFLHSYVWSVSDRRALARFGQNLTQQEWADRGVYFASEHEAGVFKILQDAAKDSASVQ